jgi:hypothetical protein
VTPGATGGPEGSSLNGVLNPDNVKDLQTEFANGWPQERIYLGDTKWKHSDLKEVSYLYTNKFFINLVVHSEVPSE